MCASARRGSCAARSSVPNISARPRSSPSPPPPAPCGRASRPLCASTAANGSGSDSGPRSSPSSTRRRDARCAPPSMKESFMAEVVLSGISKRFGKVEAVSRLTLAVGDGEFLVLLGPTGAGKTTTLRLIAGLEAPDEGHVAIAGHDVSRIPPAERDVTFVFQQYSLYPH